MIEKLKTVLAAYEYHIEQTRPIDRSAKAITDLRSVIAEMEAERPVAYVVALPGRPISITTAVWQLDQLAAMHNAPLYARPQPKQPLSVSQK